jgi:hypothetical protein
MIFDGNDDQFHKLRDELGEAWWYEAKESFMF